jgi:hypothetical protein
VPSKIPGRQPAGTHPLPCAHAGGCGMPAMRLGGRGRWRTKRRPALSPSRRSLRLGAALLAKTSSQ